MSNKFVNESLRFKCGKKIAMYEQKKYGDGIFFSCHQCKVTGIREGKELEFHHNSAEHENKRSQIGVYNETEYNKRNYDEAECE